MAHLRLPYICSVSRFSLDRLPKHLRSIATARPYGTRAKVAQGLRNIVERLQGCSDRVEVTALEAERKTLMNLNALYMEDLKTIQAEELVERVRDLETQLAQQDVGDPIVRVNKDTPFGGRSRKTTH